MGYFNPRMRCQHCRGKVSVHQTTGKAPAVCQHCGTPLTGGRFSLGGIRRDLNQGGSR